MTAIHLAALASEELVALFIRYDGVVVEGLRVVHHPRRRLPGTASILGEEDLSVRTNHVAVISVVEPDAQQRSGRPELRSCHYVVEDELRLLKGLPGIL
ncbi:hypothetical protein FQZ97_988010 [compost metagenome]